MEGFRSTVRLGDIIGILSPKSHFGKEGTVTKIDSDGTIHGTWGDIPLLHGRDSYAIIGRAPLSEKELQTMDPLDRMGIGVPDGVFYADRCDRSGQNNFADFVNSLGANHG